MIKVMCALMGLYAEDLHSVVRHKLYFEFSIGFEEAQKYRRANVKSPRRNQWQDLTCEVYI